MNHSVRFEKKRKLDYMSFTLLLTDSNNLSKPNSLFIKVKATGNEYFVAIRADFSLFGNIWSILNPPKELVDNIDLLNGFKLSDLKDTPRISIFPNGGIPLLSFSKAITSKMDPRRIFDYFEIFESELIVTQFAPEPEVIDESTAPRAIKL